MNSQIIKGLNSYLVFQLGPEKFAANIGHVKKILEMSRITKVPHAPDLYLGVINLFGEILPVVDGRKKFDFQEAEITNNTCIIVFMLPVDGDVYQVGMVVDQVLQVADLTGGDLSSPPRTGKKFRFEFISSIARLRDEFILVLNMEKLFEKDLKTIITDL
ncbi:MAG: chemotaxis protein CheW [Mangrovibacterium sp.]|nr:chemotaxis protein CheW [Mangrovibacterium sp.]